MPSSLRVSRRLRGAFPLAVLALTLSIGAPVAYAATISVNTLADELNTDGDCSLREAIEAANTNVAVDACPAGEPFPAVDVIDFSVSGTIGLGPSGSIGITDTLTIQGPGVANLSLNGGGNGRVFAVSPGVTVNLIDVTFSGSYGEVVGGTIYNEGTLTVVGALFDSNQGANGGAIYNQSGGTLTVSSSTFSGNSAIIGGAVVNSGTLIVDHSTFSGNSGSGGAINSNGTVTVTSSSFSGNFGGGAGSAIVSSGTLTVASSTFSGNTGSTAGGIAAAGTINVTNSTFSGNSGKGGGIWSNGALTVTNSTFSGNSGTNGGAGGIYSNNSNVTLRNTIVANSVTGPNCFGTLTDDGGNLQYPGVDCGPSITSADPLLDPAGLQDNGGPTQTIALERRSPAIDTAVAANCPATDQRGVLRPQGPGCEIGAFEAEVPPACTLEGSTLFVDLPASAEGEIVRAGTAIVVTIDGDPVDCGSPTIGAIDTIVVTGTIETELLQLDLSGGRFEPGATPEGTGTSEIEVDVHLLGGSDSTIVTGSAAVDKYRFGSAGANLNSDDDGDDIVLTGVESLTVNAGGGNDTISAAGGLGTGSALAIPVVLNGEFGNDKQTGGTMNDVYNGGPGKDTCTALKPADGADVCNGDAGTDTASFGKRTGTVTLTNDGVADDGSAGEGDDIRADVENLTGGKGGDAITIVLAGANTAKGGGGNDSIDVRDGTGSNGDKADGGGGTGDTCLTDAGDTELNCEA